MRVGDLFGQTLREAPSDAEIPSHKLLVRGAFIRRITAGIYAWLPLGARVLRKVSDVIREEMDAHGAVEMLMSNLQPAELWRQTGRWDDYGPVLYRIKDRSDRDYCLAPTHEEMVTFLASTELPSYRDLPKIPYQVQWKFRDEPRARGGLLRGREFLMKDAYSFDADDEGLMRSYDRMADAYRSAFARCGLSAVQIEADPGAIGGTTNHEFTQPCASGEDTYVACETCDYAANTETAESAPAAPYEFGDAPDAPVRVHTPGRVTVADVAQFLGVEPRQLVKTLLYRTAGGLVAAVIPGDREVNEFKLLKALGEDARLLDDAGFEERGIAKGYSGPLGLSDTRLLVDRSLESARNLVTGSNEADHHLTGVVPSRDFTPDEWLDLIVAEGGDLCVRCGGKLSIERGIEVGHIFQLGTKYSAPMNATFTAEDGSSRPFVMGCYGLGVSRTVAAVVEVHHDERGIVWPRVLAPFEVVVILPTSDDASRARATELTEELEGLGVEVILDDRPVSAGVKFADADLIGYPLQVVVGKTFVSSGRLEAKVRRTGERSEIESTAAAVVDALGGCR